MGFGWRSRDDRVGEARLSGQVSIARVINESNLAEAIDARPTSSLFFVKIEFELGKSWGIEIVETINDEFSNSRNKLLDLAESKKMVHFLCTRSQGRKVLSYSKIFDHRGSPSGRIVVEKKVERSRYEEELGKGEERHSRVTDTGRWQQTAL